MANLKIEMDHRFFFRGLGSSPIASMYGTLKIYIYTNIYTFTIKNKNQLNVGKYTITYMDGMGLGLDPWDEKCMNLHGMNFGSRLISDI